MQCHLLWQAGPKLLVSQKQSLCLQKQKQQPIQVAKGIQNLHSNSKCLTIPVDEYLASPLSELSAVSPIDGRYGIQTSGLRTCLSEFGLIRWRVGVECLWLQWLQTVPIVKDSIGHLGGETDAQICRLAQGGLTLNEAQEIKDIEQITRHDVKAVEYWLAKKLGQQTKSWLHFGCTSEDINNLAFGIMVKQALQNHVFPKQQQIIEQLLDISENLAGVAMLGRTHGQPASPTTMGKEMAVFAWRLARQLKQLQDVQIMGKMSGAVGNFNAHMVAFPEVDWRKYAKMFVTDCLGFQWSEIVIQVEAHDWLAEMLDSLSRFDSVLLDFDRDVWGYISLGYFKQKSNQSEVGSSTMPHKVNPIDFENSEGNIGMSEAISHHMARKLVVSRFQRDLSDSTVLRNIGVCLSHSVLAYNSSLKGISKLQVNEESMAQDLANSWEVLGEAVQTVMRRYGASDPYERLKQFSRGKAISREQFLEFVSTVEELPPHVKQEMLNLTPDQYVGDAVNQAMSVRRIVRTMINV
eukprot:TRINITY_DN6329_c0_g1_i4.p1 TRINITY_DN6329_c0_g1~~TRINITY_DN6329_c0_g1_i4.p1  ORF type:complete len:521 (+),score=49.34 TRINITY_DN6329_c0_g1_i4:429-1991(+)